MDQCSGPECSNNFGQNYFGESPFFNSNSLGLQQSFGMNPFAQPNLQLLSGLQGFAPQGFPGFHYF